MRFIVGRELSHPQLHGWSSPQGSHKQSFLPCLRHHLLFAQSDAQLGGQDNVPPIFHLV